MPRRANVLDLRSDRVPASSSSDTSHRKRQANEFMRAGLAQQDASEPIPFFCECSTERCYQPIWLTKADYDRARDDGRRLIADEHVATDLPTLRTTAARRSG